MSDDAATKAERAIRAITLEKNGVPIYVQIREQMLRLIGAGALGPGDQLPTMRQLAVALRTDLNTVRHAYDELARSGAISVLKARGTFVAERSSRPSSRASAAQIDELAEKTIAAAASAGVSPRAVAKRILQMVKGEDQ